MKHLVALLLTCCAAYAHAQPAQGRSKLDSLLRELPRMKEDTAAVMLLNGISNAYYSINPDSGLIRGRQMLVLAQKTGWKKGLALAWIEIGNNYDSQANDPDALDAFLKALKVSEESGNRKTEAMALSSIGLGYMHQFALDKALSYLFRSLRIFEAMGDKRGISSVSGNIGYTYRYQGKFDTAIKYVSKTLEVAVEQGNKEDETLALGMIGGIYCDQRSYARALAYSYRALRIAQQSGQKQYVANNLGGIGYIYLTMAKDPAVIPADSLIPAGKAALLDKAAAHLKPALEICYENGFQANISDIASNLSDVYELQKNYREALATYRRYTTIKDSLYNTANNEKITNLETKRALELKDKDIQIAKLAVAKKRNERWFFIAGIALLLGIMGILYRSFRRQQKSNTMLSKEKKRSDDLLLNILPVEVAEELKNSGASAAKQYDEVSVLFTDFVNFTGTAELLHPQQLVAELNECFTTFDAIVERNGLEKIKTIGDAYMAVCGLPASDPEHARKTVQAALEIRDFVGTRLAAARSGQAAFAIRIGINSGAVVAGIIGVKKFAYDIWGDTVNTAARMEQHGEPGHINISQSTYELVKDHYRCDYRGKIAAKNKGAVEMYFVEAAVPQPV